MSPDLRRASGAEPPSVTFCVPMSIMGVNSSSLFPRVESGATNPGGSGGRRPAKTPGRSVLDRRWVEAQQAIRWRFKVDLSPGQHVFLLAEKDYLSFLADSLQQRENPLRAFRVGLHRHVVQ